jgi:pyruvate dehydrogenase (quinone)
MVFLGNPEYGCEPQPIDFAAVARGFGVQGFTIEDPPPAATSCGRPSARRALS